VNKQQQPTVDAL